MDPQQITIMTHKFQAVLVSALLRVRGARFAICLSLRLIHICLSVLSVLSSLCASVGTRSMSIWPACGDMQLSMDWLRDARLRIVVSPETASEHTYLLVPASLRGDVFLADRGYLGLSFLRDIARHGGFFIVRGKA